MLGSSKLKLVMVVINLSIRKPLLRDFLEGLTKYKLLIAEVTVFDYVVSIDFPIAVIAVFLQV